MILKSKNAIVYGGGGAIGSAVAIAFAREGAKVFLAGRSSRKLELVKERIIQQGGSAEVGVVDTTNAKDVERHFRSIEAEGIRIHISFNATGIPQTGIQGIKLLDLTDDQVLYPMIQYTKSNFLTARAAARHMVLNNSGVIMMLTAPPSKISAPNVGGMAPTWASIEAFTRTFATEFGASGVRVVCLRPDGIPESDTITEVYGLHARANGIDSHLGVQQYMENLTLLKRLPTLMQVANTAVFIASDWAGAITGSVVNLSCGSVVD